MRGGEGGGAIYLSKMLSICFHAQISKSLLLCWLFILLITSLNYKVTIL